MLTCAVTLQQHPVMGLVMIWLDFSNENLGGFSVIVAGFPKLVNVYNIDIC